MTFRLIFFAVVALTFAAVTPAHAQLQVTHTPPTSPVLGSVIRGTSSTTFSINASGAVTRSTGDATRLSSASVTIPSINISCGFLNLSGLCALRQVRVTIQAGTSSPARIVNFRVNSLTGNLLYAGSAPAPASTLTFDLKPLGLLGTGSFTLSMDVQLDANAASGVKTFDYTVTATFI